jgi:sugar/nucleoside kinase (ribokinase family)
MPEVLVYGSIGYDVITSISNMPEPGKDADVLAEEWHLGGEACNISVALARWGVKVAVGGNRIAEDEGGGFVRRKLSSSGVDITQVGVCTRAATPFCRILVAPGGERFILSYGHKDARFTLPDNNLLQSAKILVTDRFGGKIRDAITGVAKVRGLKVVSVDVTPAEEMRLRNSDVIITSRHFIENSVGNMDVETFVQEMQAASGGAVVVTRGPDPVIYTEGKNLMEIEVPQVDKIVDTTGAGDTFTAGFVYGMLKGWEIAECVRFGAAAASLSIKGRGADNPPTLEQVMLAIRR